MCFCSSSSEDNKYSRFLCHALRDRLAYSLVIQLDNLIAVLLEVVQVLDLVFVALYCLRVSLLKVDIFHCKQLLFVVKDLIDLKEAESRGR